MPRSRGPAIRFPHGGAARYPARVRAVEVLCALPIFAILARYVQEKRGTGRMGEMLFACHVAALAVALGLLAGAGWLVGPAFVFSVGVGIPAWLIEVIATRKVTLLSSAAHLAPPAAAALHLARRGLPSGSALSAWGTFVALLVLSFVATDPALNVNLAHRPSREMAAFAPTPWAARLLMAGVTLGALLVAEWGFARVFGRSVAAEDWG
ncbi:hypothetical protein BE15_39385 [Sorangium cellulosum]|uniref:Uncharacterized protein n=1 Tax=Sorangium cellulosum TaxID=56 RepID=A0A150QUQ1_SORCE|nr:hypothetical protein BE15_39385 [Sorangium cellulosum]